MALNYRILNNTEASTILSNPDDYSRNINQFSLQLINQRSPDSFLRSYQLNCRTFNQNETNQIHNHFQDIIQKLERIGINLNIDISIAKTSGLESMGMPYTRHNVIVLTEPYLMAMSMGRHLPNINSGTDLIAHELFHIISRNIPDSRNELYAIWNFYYEPLINIPQNIIVNPDAPNCNYKINIDYMGEAIKATPILYVNNMSIQSMMNADKQLLLENGQIISRDRTNYLEKSHSPSTSSAYHPEEISAEAFRLLLSNINFNKKEEFLNFLLRTLL